MTAMRPSLRALPPPPAGRSGWPWTEEAPPVPERPNGAEWPRVTIVMPCFNAARYVEEAIRSVLLQGYPELELIVVDGGSSDGTVEVIRRYEAWIASWTSEKDRGQSHAINKGLRRSTGRYFNWHNADDVLPPRALAAAAEAFWEHADAAYVHGRVERIDEQSRLLPDDAPHRPDGYLPTPAEALAGLWGGHQPGGLMDRSLVLEVGSVDESLHNTMDIDLLLRLAIRRRPYYIDRPVARFRVHAESKTANYDTRHGRERFEIVRKLFASSGLPPELRACRGAALAEAHRFVRQRCLQSGRRWRAQYHDAWRILHGGSSALGEWRPWLGELAHLCLPGLLRRKDSA